MSVLFLETNDGGSVGVGKKRTITLRFEKQKSCVSIGSFRYSGTDVIQLGLCAGFIVLVILKGRVRDVPEQKIMSYQKLCKLY